MAQRIASGIVLYNPNIEELENCINSIYYATDCLIIVDNGSDNIFEIHEILQKYPKIILLCNEKNLGIATALNQICEKASQKGYKYSLLLDQDSECPDNMIPEYLKELQRHGNYLGILCPIVHDKNTHELYSCKGNSDINSYEIAKCITSGSLVSIDAWNAVNGFDETMFIDGVDFDFCIRIRKKGFKIFEVKSVNLSHKIGNALIYKIGSIKIYIFGHSSFRKYYIARNIIFLNRKIGGLYNLKSFFQILKQLSLIFLFENEKLEKFKAICRGVYDGVRIQIDSRWKI